MRPEDPNTKVPTRSKVQWRRSGPCLNLSHLMELHPEVRNVLPELQEVDSQGSRARAFRARVGLGSQDWRSAWQEKQMRV